MMPVASYIDHTLLKAFCTASDIEALCNEANKYGFAAVCVPPCHVPLAASLTRGSQVKVCTVVGFPLGYSNTATKIFETREMIQNGAQEIDVVVNVSWIKSQQWEKIEAELEQLSTLISSQNAVFKLIFETAYLDMEEILRLTDLCLQYKVDYLKTSTGFAPRGADLEIVKAIKNRIGNRAKIKASGGISDLATAMAFIEAGADRIGTSSGIKIAESPSNS